MYENGSVGYLNVLLESDGFSDFLKRAEYVKKLMEYDNTLLTRYQNNETIIANNVKTITEDKRNLEVLEARQKDKKAALDKSIEEKNAIVKQLDSNVNTYEQQIKDLQNQDSEVQKLINKAAADAAAAAKKKTSAKSSSSAQN